MVIRGAGVGDGEGDGSGEGEAAGVWANASSGIFDAASPAAPIAGSSFTKFRLPSFTRDLVLFFFIIVLVFIRGIRGSYYFIFGRLSPFALYDDCG